MLSIWQAALLGALQGATEFLPVSSSGHLVVVQQLLGWMPESSVILSFDIALHVGTLISVLIVFRKDVWEMLAGKNWRLLGYLALATIPAVVVGFTLKDWFESLFSSVQTVGITWAITGVVLILTKFAKPADGKDIGWLKSFIIGCAQAVAIIPGISRSGSTIAAGLFSKLNRETAARFAFLMSIPAIGGSAVLDAKNLINFPKESIASLIVGVVVSAFVGYVCIKWLLKIVSRGQVWWFGIYCLAASLVTLVLLNIL